MLCPPLPCGLVSLLCFSLLFWGLPVPKQARPPWGSPSALPTASCRRGSPTRGRPAAQAAAPAGPDLAVSLLPAWHRGGKTGRRAPPFLAGVWGTAVATTRQQQLPPARIRSDREGVGHSRAGAPARWGRLWGGSRGPEARPAHRTRSGPRPGAFRACAAACLGKSRPSSRRHGPARQSGGGDSRNLPGDRWRVTRHYEPRYGQCFRCVSGESPGARGWAGLRLRTVRFSPKRRHGPWW